MMTQIKKKTFLPRLKNIFVLSKTLEKEFTHAGFTLR